MPMLAEMVAKELGSQAANLLYPDARCAVAAGGAGFRLAVRTHAASDLAERHS